MTKVNKTIDDLNPEELKALLNEEDLEPIRKGSYTFKEYGEETLALFKDSEYKPSKEFGVYATLWSITQQNPKVRGDIRTVWKKVIDEYDGLKEWGDYSLYEPLTQTELTPLDVYDYLLGRPLRDQEEFLRGLIPTISAKRELEDSIYRAVERETLKIYPHMREECIELVKLREELGDPEPEIYSLEYALAETVKSNIDRAPEEPFDLGFIKSIRFCYEWSKQARESIKALENLEQTPYSPLIEWIRSLAPEDKNVLGYNITLVRVKEALDIIIDAEGLTEDSPGDLKTIQRKWKKKIVKFLRETYEEEAIESRTEIGSLGGSVKIVPIPTPDFRTLGVDKGNRSIPLIKTEPTTLDNFDWHAEAFVNFASKDKSKNELQFQVYTPQGERQGLTGIERAISGYIGTLLRQSTPQGMANRDRYSRVEITENDFIKKLMGLVEGENIKTHQEEIYNTLIRMSMSRIEVDIPKSNKNDDKFVKAVEELYLEMNPGARPSKSKDKNIKIAVQKNMLSFEVVKVIINGAEVRKYIFETMPFNEYLSIKFKQIIQVRDSLYRTPVLIPEDLTQNARAKAEEYGLYSTDRKTKGQALMLENNLDNLGLKDWVASTIELKRAKYGSPVILEYDKLFAQIKGASIPLTEREKRTIKTNLKRYLVYLMNNPESDVIDFKEQKAPKSKKIESVHVYLRGSKKERLDDIGES